MVWGGTVTSAALLPRALLENLGNVARSHLVLAKCIG